MMRNTIRTAVSSVAYLRNLFDEEAFEDKNVSGLQLKVLRPFNQESKLIINWLEDGVFDALERQYLKLLVFGIHGESDELIESYHFHFNYSESGANIDVRRKIKDQYISRIQKINSNSGFCTKEYARQQTMQLLRALILLTQSLSPLPESRYMSMKLWYYEDRVPKDYEPNHFRPARTSDILSFNEIPVDTMIGNIDTKFHSLTVKIKSAVDNYEENIVDFSLKNHEIQKNQFLDKKQIMSLQKMSLKKIGPKNSKKRRKPVTSEVNTGLSMESNGTVIEDILTNLNNSPRDDRTTKTTNTLELLDKATEIVKFLKFVNKSNLAMALDIEREKAGNIIEVLLDYGILSNKVIKKKGYPVINKEIDERKIEIKNKKQKVKQRKKLNVYKI